MKRILVGALCILAMANAGCLAVVPMVAVGGAFYHSAKKNQSHNEFMANIQQVNAEREKNGLTPLDVCTEKYNLDRSWARQDPGCRRRISRYERGDSSALAVPLVP